MKKIITIIAIIVNNILFSQTITKPLENSAGVEEGVYYKDFNYILDGFEGTYEYSGTDFYFKLVLEKKVMENNNNSWWTDLLKGSYKYVKNGVAVNFLNDPMASDDNPARVQADWINNNQPTFCPECLPNTKWLRGYISDDTTNKSAQLFIAKKVVNGVEGIQVQLSISAASQQPWESDNPIFLPINDFFMVKI